MSPKKEKTHSRAPVKAQGKTERRREQTVIHLSVFAHRCGVQVNNNHMLPHPRPLSCPNLDRPESEPRRSVSA